MAWGGEEWSATTYKSWLSLSTDYYARRIEDSSITARSHFLATQNLQFSHSKSGISSLPASHVSLFYDQQIRALDLVAGAPPEAIAIGDGAIRCRDRQSSRPSGQPHEAGDKSETDGVDPS